MRKLIGFQQLFAYSNDDWKLTELYYGAGSFDMHILKEYIAIPFLSNFIFVWIFKCNIDDVI